ncbi:Auxin responsive SAUR protein [Corchorus capsularis]|uniref:Auxin responsive SAUR protein n=1 Tax=Corchorus capsularis TaxID=210143 RepID=A0A1R3H6D4_COCAP|nr:Auxin responsive SAUR protein [Corchorus capsularis]
MKKINLILRKCKSLSRQLGRSSSYSSLRSKSAREDHVWDGGNGEDCETIYVGSTRKRYVISSKYLNHPLLNALIERRSTTTTTMNSKENSNKQQHAAAGGDDHDILVKCEVVLFDHLLWMLENSDPNLILDSLEELADLYVF